MDLVLLATAFLFLVVLVVAVVVFVLPLIRRPGGDRHDDLLRAGVDPATDIGTATDRATGTTAWMRPGGGGV